MIDNTTSLRRRISASAYGLSKQTELAMCDEIDQLRHDLASEKQRADSAVHDMYLLANDESFEFEACVVCALKRESIDCNKRRWHKSENCLQWR